MKKEIALGIDIGGTNTAFGLVDREGNYLAGASIATDKHADINDYLKEMSAEIEKLNAFLKGQFEILGIGIGAPNANYYKGTIENAVNLRWKGVIPFCNMLKAYFPDIPSFITNDANAAAIGEMVYGGAKDMKDFVMVTLGTGLGSGFVANGKLIYGHDSFAGELGHINVEPHGRQCNCGLQGCLETYVSATGVKRTVFEMMSRYNDPSPLRDISFNEMSAKKVSELAEQNDKIALKTFAFTGELLGKALANTVAITSPEAVFLFGGLAKSGRLIFDPTKEALDKNVLSTFAGKVKLLPSQLSDNAAVYGAAALAWNELKK
ncbi:glucokinase [Bacteroidia bacterium]|nr:glucokinase [Bacteroidia bacterium]